MTASTLAKPAALAVKPHKRPKVWRCNFCANGHHGSCPGAVRHLRRVKLPGETESSIRPVLWRCLCDEPGHPKFPYCTTCKNDHDGEVNAETWLCVDSAVCAGKLAVRRQNSQLWQTIQAAKSHSALRRKARRAEMESALAGVAADQDDKIEQLHDMLDSLIAARKTQPTNRKKAAKPKIGKCECCGEPTRGGRFLPGHDAKLVSALMERIRSGDREAYAEIQRRCWTKKVPAKLRDKMERDPE